MSKQASVDQDWLDTQYNIRAAVPERQHYADLWRTSSEAARSNGRGRLDLSYGPAPDERFDFFPSSQKGNAPLLVFLHGGYWRANDKSDFSFLAPNFNEIGVSVISANYSLAPGASLEIMVEQTRRLIAHVVRNSNDFGIDRNRIFLSGHSAGGHLTLMALETDWSKYGLDECPIRGACSVSGLYDLEPLRLSFLNEVIRLTPKMSQETSPMLRLGYINKTIWSKRPVIFCVGGKETQEFLRQQSDFVSAWARQGLMHSVVEQPDDHHYSVILRLAEKNAPLHEAVIAMIKSSQ